MAKSAKKAAPAATTKTSEKAPKKAAAKKEAAPKKAAAKKQPKKTNAGLMQPLEISSDLTAVIGKGPFPRTEIIKKIWDYIKKNDLQDKENRRMINADDKLKVVFAGKEQISMFELAKVINNHVK